MKFRKERQQARDAKRDTHVQADPQAARNRRRDASTAPRREVSPTRFREVTDNDSIVDACVELLAGTSEPVKVFGLELSSKQVELREEEGSFAAIQFWGAEYDNDSSIQLEDLIRPGFYVSVGKVIRGTKANFKNASEEALALTLFSREEMQEAIAKRREQVAAAKEAETKKTNDFIANLRQKAGGAAGTAPTEHSAPHEPRPERPRREKRARPTLEHLKDILTVEDGVIEHGGVTLMVCEGGAHTVIRVVKAPEGHAMHEQFRRALAVHQESIQYLDESPADDGDEKQILRRKMQDWLRGELVASGVNLTTAPAAKAEASQNGHAAAEPAGDTTGKAVGAGSLAS